MLSVGEILVLRRAGKSLREIANQEGVSKSAIYGRLERNEKPWLNVARQRRYRECHTERFVKLRRKYSRALSNRNQNATVSTAVNRRQYWTMSETSELENRVKRGETTKEIALAMGRTFKGISRAFNRFGLSMRRSELMGAGDHS